MIRKRFEILLAASAIAYGAYDMVEQRFSKNSTGTLEYATPVGDLNNDGEEDMRFFTDKGPAFDLVSIVGNDGSVRYKPTEISAEAVESRKRADLR